MSKRPTTETLTDATQIDTRLLLGLTVPFSINSDHIKSVISPANATMKQRTNHRKTRIEQLRMPINNP